MNECMCICVKDLCLYLWYPCHTTPLFTTLDIFIISRCVLVGPPNSHLIRICDNISVSKIIANAISVRFIAEYFVNNELSDGKN